MVKEKIQEFRKEFRNQSVIAIIAAFGFLIALSWRDFISDSINSLVTALGVSEKLYLYKLLSAVFITLIAILGIMIVSKLKIEGETKDK